MDLQKIKMAVLNVNATVSKFGVIMKN